MTFKEVSSNFDRKNVAPFLSRLPPLIESGFSSQQVSQVVGSMDELKRKQEKDFEFPIRFRGAPATLKIKVVMDDIDSPNLYFFTTPALADLIDGDLRRFLEEHGL